MPSSRTRALLPLAAAALTGSTLLGPAALAAPDAAPRFPHVFVIDLENKGYDETWGAGSAAPYLSETLRPQGQLLTDYYGIGHNSLVNYIAQISGQAPNLGTQSDCPLSVPFIGWGTADHGQAYGQGCVYPASVPTVADQLTQAGLTWKSYDEGMAAPCTHPPLWAADPNTAASAGDEYATRHNPFVYFTSITSSPACAADDVPLGELSADLTSAASTAALTFVSPDLCDDGHDAPCADGHPGGLASADAWLSTWVPRIMASPAYRQDGLVIITFDESDNPAADSTACCGEQAGPNAALPGILGPGGGRVGALLLSPRVAPGSSDAAGYNHYSLLRTIEDDFGLAPLGFADSATGFAAGAPAARAIPPARP
ncbi:alkaline phosphatase family protein [Kitasatospora mediocidica]|uniref:alkaline phosphatase family protein n=1 Tax=Kitasatospora mediocidica TaxID=58352 RepID=UPI00055D9116|nr:alkaline phosphatase family protein [Kitasatospora mediocidica]